jgi:hypothetical protein
MDDTIYLVLDDKTFTSCDSFVVDDKWFVLTVYTGEDEPYVIEYILISRVKSVYAGYYAYGYLTKCGYKYVPFEDMVYDDPA